MNYLAHLFLAGDTAESLIGNLAGDFVKGPLGERFPPAIRQGIMEHRRIDAFTDAHPSVAAFRRVLIPEHGHWSRVIADVFFDHFLASDFEAIAGEPLDAFLDRVHALIDRHAASLPERLAAVYPRMRDQRWLASYGEREGIAMALRGLSRRIASHPPLADAVRHLDDSRGELERRFRDFLPDVVAFANAIRSGA
jgi:acyl carrier protein phosphodiesterase